MNPTQNQDTGPDPTTVRDNILGYVRMTNGLPSLVLRAELVEDESVGYTLTDAGRQALDAPPAPVLPGAGGEGEPVAFVAVRGWCELCSRALPWKCTWDEPLCSDCVVVIPAPSQTAGTPVEVLQDAALYLERHGWIQGAYYDSTSGSFTPPACLVGAIGMVCYGGPVDAPAQHFDDLGFLDFEQAVLHLDRYLLAEDGSESYEFNDAKGRRLEDVTHVLRDAATRPADELIDALRAVDEHNADMAALSATLIPGGTFAEGGNSGGDVR